MNMFHVCQPPGQNIVYEVNLVGDIMKPLPSIPPGGEIVVDLPPELLPIWMEEINGVIYQWQITVDTSSGAPLANYVFFDQTGDSYSLMAYTPMKHTVAYNSTAPYINKICVSVLEPKFHLPTAWTTAPQCSRS